MDRIRNPEHEVTIAVVGKYIEHRDAYKSIYESLDHAGFTHSTRVMVKRIDAEDLEEGDPKVLLAGIDGLLIPGGFGTRGIQGKIKAIQYARESNIPFFGICLGMQCATIEFARNVLGLKDANSTEFTAETEHPVICMLEDQKKITYKGGTMRLGTQPCFLQPNSIAAECYGDLEISERHRHRYEFNPEYRKQFIEAGMKTTGVGPNDTLVEIIELEGHPWFVAVQYHPEFKSKPLTSHPLFFGFLQAALSHRQSSAAILG